MYRDVKAFLPFWLKQGKPVKEEEELTSVQKELRSALGVEGKKETTLPFSHWVAAYDLWGFAAAADGATPLTPFTKSPWRARLFVQGRSVWQL